MIKKDLKNEQDQRRQKPATASPPMGDLLYAHKEKNQKRSHTT